MVVVGDKDGGGWCWRPKCGCISVDTNSGYKWDIKWLCLQRKHYKLIFIIKNIWRVCVFNILHHFKAFRLLLFTFSWYPLLAILCNSNLNSSSWTLRASLSSSSSCSNMRCSSCCSWRCCSTYMQTNQTALGSRFKLKAGFGSLKVQRFRLNIQRISGLFSPQN